MRYLAVDLTRTSLADALLPEDMQRRWFARPDGHRGQVAGFYGMVTAGRAAA